MGSVNIDNTGSGADVTLSSDGTDLLLDGTAIGGGGGAALELYAENPSSPTAPSATGGNAVAIGSGASATNLHAISIGRNTTATGIYALSLNGNAVPTYSAAIGYNSAGGRATTATGQGSHAFGGSYASGTDSFAAAIANNTSSYGAAGANSVAIGQNAYAGGSGAVSLGTSSLANGIQSHAFGGTSSGAYSVALGGTASGSVAVSLKGATASGDRSLAVGFRAVASKYGQKAFASGRFAADGDAQGSMFILRAATTDATATIPTADGGSAGSTNQVILPNNSAYSFSGTIIARESAAAGSDYASWEIKGALLRDANAASTVLGNGIKNKLYASAGASAWDIALTADTTNGGLKIEATGAAATNIRWVATVNTSEVTYA